MTYDPAGRLYQLQPTGGAGTRFLYDGPNLVGEYNTSNVLLRRYVQGPGMDAPLVRYDGTGTSNKRWLLADERGSIIAETNTSGAVVQVNSYDDYGLPASGNVGRFGYTGQLWLGEIGMYSYKNRMYHPGLGRFLQPDPIGLEGGMNLYAYVGGDPINFTDPWGFVRQRVCQHPREARGIRRCVEVETGTDEELTPAQVRAIQDAFGGFIGRHGRIGSAAPDISGFGKDVVGNASDAHKMFARVVSQFVGYAIHSHGGWLAGHWAEIGYIRASMTAGSFISEEPAYIKPDDNGVIYIHIKGRSLGGLFGNPYSHAGALARVYLHEVLHLRYGPTPRRADHLALDHNARWLLAHFGLAGARCPAGWGFPGCD